jgi:hypothetical protein
VALLVGANGSPRPAPDETRGISTAREPAVSLHHDRAADSVTALITTIALTVTIPVRVVGIRVIEWKRRKEWKTEVVDNNGTVEVVKSVVAIEVVESSEIGCAVKRWSAPHRHSRRCGQHSGTVDWHPSHRGAMPHPLCPRCRDRKEA